MNRIILPACAGLLAAVAGAITKCAVDSDTNACMVQFGYEEGYCPPVFETVGLSCDNVSRLSGMICLWNLSFTLFNVRTEQGVFLLRLVWGALMLLANGYMLELFVKSLHSVGSLLTTVVHLVANFASTVRITYM